MSSADNTVAKSLEYAGEEVIAELDDIVIDQIAAGEVVERPASVVKELVENSIDAGATEITVVIENGGKSYIQVIDNGIGLTAADAELAVKRFCTSKIRSADDLLMIATLGFRGEALSSIASVSRFSLHSVPKRTPEKGVSLSIEGGKKVQTTDWKGESGTSIEVRNLFFNVPARRKFLKTDKTESAIIKSLLTDISLAYPKLRCRLVVDGKEVLNLAPAKDIIHRARELSVAGKTPIEIDFSREAPGGTLSIKGLLSAPAEAIVASSRMRVIVNGRALRDRLLLRAIRDGFGGMLKGGKYPRGVLAITIPPREVDVNVHPQKSEVRFRHGDLMFSSVYSSIKQALEQTKVLSFRPDERQERSPEHFQEAIRFFPASNTALETTQDTSFYPQSLSLDSRDTQVREKVPVTSFTSQPLSSMRYLGQIFKCFLLFEGGEEFALLDMHAAHERVVFYQLKSQFLSKSISSQQLLIPETVSVEPEFASRFDQIEPTLKRFGIVAEAFGEDSLVVRALPAALGSVAAEQLFQDLSSLPLEDSGEAFLTTKLDAILIRIACHGSIRSGREMEAEEVYALLSQLEKANESALCPHGRPVEKRFSRKNVEDFFERD